MIRVGKLPLEMFFLVRIFNYLFFYGCCLLLLFVKRPENILYFETLSSYAACLYKKYFKKKVNLLAHYHEYTSPEQYKSGMKLEYYFHQIEKKLSNQFTWVSHTNGSRLSKYKTDILPYTIKDDAGKILPNYPPTSWTSRPKSTIDFPVRVVYIGALSLTTMYTKQFADWVVAQNGKILWDIFSYNFADEARVYIKCLKSDWIRIHDGVNYEELPDILRAYDVGVVLYTGHIPNYIYNAPNKLFEYLACGLDVWFPRPMTGSNEFIKEAGFPKVLSIDFTELGKFDLSKALRRDGAENKFTFFCEDALMPLVNKLTDS